MEADTRPTVSDGSVLAAEAGPHSLERSSSFVEAHVQESTRPLTSAPFSRSYSLKDGTLSEEEDEEKVCRVCCCVEPDQDGEDALAVLGITSHLAILQEQSQKREEQRRRRSASLSRSSTRGQEGQALSSAEGRGRGSFRGLAADLARRIFQKEDASATPGREGTELKRTRSLSGPGLPPPVPTSRSLPRSSGNQEAQPQGDSDTAVCDEGVVSEHVVDMPTEGSYSKLLQLRCHCQGDLSLCHYACFLRWVVSRGTSGAQCDNKCEICGQPAMNVSQDDIDAINKALRLRRRVVVLASQTDPQQQQEGAEADPQPQAQEPASEPSLRPPVLEESPSSLSDGEEPLDAPETIARVAAAAWFDPLNRGAADRNRRLGQVLHLDRPGSYLTDAIYPMTRGTKMVVEVLGILLATALLTLTLSRLFMDVLSHKEISFGLHYILASIISFIVVLWFRIVAIPRLRSGPARSGAVVMCVWLMVLGVWFSGTKPSNKD